jgi:DNA polymerase-3 subunit epsilon
MYLFFDTETTGLPKNWKAPVTELANWPRIVQIAWVLTDKAANVLEQASYIIKPDNFVIPAESSKIHGITTEEALKNGADIQEVLALFSGVIDKSKLLIAHNADFDIKVIGAEFLRLEMPNNLLKIPAFCTKEETTEFCQLPGNYHYKWPTLQELYCKLFNEDIKNAHDALSDVKTCLKCFFELKNRGIITVPEIVINETLF